MERQTDQAQRVSHRGLRPAEDWTASFQGAVADFYAADLVSSAVALHYGCIPGAGGNFPDC